MDDISHQGWGCLFEWGIFAKQYVENLNVDFLAAREIEMLKNLRWSSKRLNEWILGSWVAKKAAAGLLERVHRVRHDATLLSSLVIKDDLSLCEIDCSSAEEISAPPIHLAVGQSGDYLVALAWFAAELRCGVDVRSRQLTIALDSRFVFTSRELSQVRALMCGQSERRIETALADWAVIGWSLKYAASQATQSGSDFNPQNFHIRFNGGEKPGSGEVHIYPLEARWSGIPLRCTWVESRGHIFAFAYNDISATAERSPMINWTSQPRYISAQQP